MSQGNYTPDQLEQIKTCLSDWRWRFQNLYWIKPAEPEIPECVFKPRDEQWEILEEIYEKGQLRVAILKARQLGFSTLLALICLDMILFRAGFIAGIVDQTQDDAKKKMDKIFFAWDRLPDDIRGAYDELSRNKSELSIRRKAKQGAKLRPESTIYAGMNARGGTHQLLWISEWGAIQFDDPDRSDNIADGALPSAEQGIIVVETTWKGGKTGRLYTEVVEPALKILERYRTVHDWKVYFYAWWLDARYWREGSIRQIGKECLEYLAEVEEDEQIDIPDGQKVWYWKVAWPKRQKRFEEYPSRLKEIFMSPVDGAIYAELMDEAMIAGRIIDFKLSKEPVVVAWDIGKRDLMSLVFIQRVGMQDRVYDYHLEQGATIERVVRYIQNWASRENAFVSLYMLPHDGAHERLGKTYNKSIEDIVRECGVNNIVVVPRIPKIGVGIDQVRDRIPSMIFHRTNLERVYEFGSIRISFMDAMNNYRYAALSKNVAGREPLHDVNSHPCDSLRTYSEGDERGLVPKAPGIQQIDDRELERGDARAVTDFEFWDD